MAAWGGSGNSGCRSGRLGWLCRQLGRLPPRPPQASPGLPRNMTQLLGVGGVPAPRVLGLVLDSWLLLGCSWLLMAAPRVLGLALDSWLLLGCSRLLLAAPGCSRLLWRCSGPHLWQALFPSLLSYLFFIPKPPQTYLAKMVPIPGENSKKLEKMRKSRLI